MRRDLVAVLLVAIFLGLMAARVMAEETHTIDLNHATMQELMALPGVGAKRAEEILRYRLAHPFRRTSDLMRIKGLGSKLFVKIRPLVRVDPEGQAHATPPSAAVDAVPPVAPRPAAHPVAKGE